MRIPLPARLRRQALPRVAAERSRYSAAQGVAGLDSDGAMDRADRDPLGPLPIGNVDLIAPRGLFGGDENGAR